MRDELRLGQAQARSKYRGRPFYVELPGGAREYVQPEDRFPTPEELLARRPEEMDWADLSLLRDVDPEAAEAFWRAIRREAREALQSGHLAAGVIERDRSGPFSRALYLETRQALIEDWQPRPGTEQMLVDSLAQSHALRARYLCLAVEFGDYVPRDANPNPEPGSREEHDQRVETYLPPRLPQAEAVERAMMMVERFDRMIMRAIRALRDLRRYAPAIHIENQPGGQINVGTGPQLNVNQGGG